MYRISIKDITGKITTYNNIREMPIIDENEFHVINTDKRDLVYNLDNVISYNISEVSEYEPRNKRYKSKEYSKYNPDNITIDEVIENEANRVDM